MTRTELVAVAIALSALGTLASAAFAQDYPTRPIKVVVPQPPGGGFDLTARTVSEPLAALLGQPVVVENRPGSGTLVGTEVAAKADPDGYTLLLGALANIALNPGLYDKLPYDPQRDFVPIGLVASFPYTLVARKDLPQNTLKEIVAYARANPDKLTYASGGNGSGQHIGAAVIWHLAKVDVTHVPYKGAQAAYQDLLAGRVDRLPRQLRNRPPHVQRGRVKAIAMSAATNGFPTIPTSRPCVRPAWSHFDMATWMGYFAPAKTPAPIVERLRAEFDKVAQCPTSSSASRRAAAAPMRLSVAETEALVKRDIESGPR